MSEVKTLLEMSGADLTPARLKDASLVIIDMQNEYLDGPIALPDAAEAVSNTEALLGRAREHGAPVLHVAQSSFHDIVPATAKGLDTVWINRPNKGAAKPVDATPTWTFTSMAEFAAAIGT